MIDLHCHILPSVDDGASGLDESVGIVQLLRSFGFTGAAASPHHGGGPGGDVTEAVAEVARAQLRQALDAAGIAFEIFTYKYAARGGTAVSSRELGVDEHRVIKTLVMATSFVTTFFGTY